jgi:hypothetical protein
MNNSILPESRLAIAMALVLAIGAYRMADAQTPPAPSLQDQLRSCAAVADAAHRLTCFDRLAAALAPAASAAAPIPVAPPAAPPAAPAPPAVPVASAAAASGFGVSNGPLAAKEQSSKPKSMTAVVAAVSSRGRGELVVTLDNGQVWVQNQAVDYFPLKPGDRVEINVGALESYVMWVPSTRRACKVTRVR